MFSGIIETRSRVLSARRDRGLVIIQIERPPEFSDIEVGDSVAVNGVCLTVEKFDVERMTFALAAETLQVTGWSETRIAGAMVNLERSLRLNDRIHGHLVTGHVDGLGEVESFDELAGSKILKLKIPPRLAPYVWQKGSWAVNGVSLTINSVVDQIVECCLIPETLRRTNLEFLQVAEVVNLEVDMIARGLVSYLASRSAEIEAHQTKARMLPGANLSESKP